jgi:hypothetical protein
MRQNGKPAAIAPRDDSYDTPGGSAGENLLARGATMARMQIGQYTTAIQVQKPRSLKALQAAVIEEAELLGQDFLYGWEVNDKNSPSGKSWIEGVSIDGAMILARNWGNCATPVQLVEDAPAHWLMEATFVDLETGYTVQRLFRQRKTESHSKSMEGDRKLDIAFQIGQSKAQRNVIVKAMPAWLINAATTAALSSTVSKYEKDLPKFRQVCVKAYAPISVTQAMLEKKVGLPVDAWTARDLAKLSSLHKAIVQEKVTTVAEAFAEEPATPATPATQGASQPTSAQASGAQSAESDAAPEQDDAFGGGPTRN